MRVDKWRRDETPRSGQLLSRIRLQRGRNGHDASRFYTDIDIVPAVRKIRLPDNEVHRVSLCARQWP